MQKYKKVTDPAKLLKFLLEDHVYLRTTNVKLRAYTVLKLFNNKTLYHVGFTHVPPCKFVKFTPEAFASAQVYGSRLRLRDYTGYVWNFSMHVLVPTAFCE